jgi:hypothetical protein
LDPEVTEFFDAVRVRSVSQLRARPHCRNGASGLDLCWRWIARLVAQEADGAGGGLNNNEFGERGRAATRRLFYLLHGDNVAFGP